MKKNILLIIRILVSFLFFLSALAKLYPTPIYGITKIFEEGQLIPMGFSENFAPYLCRYIIAIEFFIGVAILQRNYLKKVVIPASIFLVVIFSLHLSYEIFEGNSENCGCFGELIPMTPLQALIKNVVTILVLFFLYKKIEMRNKENDLRIILIQLLTILLIIFAFIPVSNYSKNTSNNFISHVDSEKFNEINVKRILCFFDAGCEHCQDAAKALDSISSIVDVFPEVHIIFSDTEAEKIPAFFDFVGAEFSYQVMPFENYATDEIDSYMEITFPDYDNPIIILYDGSKQIRLFEGVGDNEFKADELIRILEG